MLKKEGYFKSVRRPYPPFFASLILSGYSNYKYYQPFIDERFVYRNVIKSDNCWYYGRAELNKIARITLNSWLSPVKLKKAIKLMVEREKRLVSSAGLDIKNFCRAYEPYMPALLLVWAPEWLLEAEIKKLLLKKLSVRETERLLEQIRMPEQDNFYKQEEYDLVISKDIKKHVRKYIWINSRYGEENYYTVAEAKQRLAQINKKEFFKKWQAEKSELKKALKRAKEILGGKNRSLVDFLQFITYYRTRRTDIMNKAGFLFIPELKKIAREKKLIYRQLLHCTKDEILNEIPAVKIIEGRMKDHAMILDQGGIQCVTGRESERIRNFLKEKISKVKEIKGIVASRGFTKGIVRLIVSKENYSKMAKGDILVTSMTTPEMMSVMRLAGAFITDEGGITCHAAIVSREMKKPCIIGTKIATKALKDGDLVEVDANRGVVKKL